MPKLMSEYSSDLTDNFSPEEGRDDLRDISRKHEGSLVKYKGIVYRCCGRAYVSKTTGAIYLVVYGKTNESSGKFLLPLDRIDSKYPAAGWYNHIDQPRGICTYLDRKTIRQWRIGYHKSVAHHSYPYCEEGDLLWGFMMKNTAVCTPTSSMFVGSEYQCRSYATMSEDYAFTYTSAVNALLTKKAFSVAINREMCVASSPFTDDEVGLFLGLTKVATIDKNLKPTIIAKWATTTVEEICND